MALVHYSQPLLSEQVWVTRGRFILTMSEKEMILQGDKLNDRVVNVA